MKHVACLLAVVPAIASWTMDAAGAARAKAAAPATRPAGAAADRGGRELGEAAKRLAEMRGAMSAMLARRAAADAAQAPPLDVLLDMTEALTSYANVQLRPRPSSARRFPTWTSTPGSTTGGSFAAGPSCPASCQGAGRRRGCG